VQAAIAGRVQSLKLAPISGRAGGAIEGAQSRRAETRLAFVMSLVFMYLILAAQFESWLHHHHSSVAALTLPFALLSIIIFQQSLNILSAPPARALRRGQKNSILQDRHATS